jgi:hypothetical protein
LFPHAQIRRARWRWPGSATIAVRGLIALRNSWSPPPAAPRDRVCDDRLGRPSPTRLCWVFGALVRRRGAFTRPRHIIGRATEDRLSSPLIGVFTTSTNGAIRRPGRRYVHRVFRVNDVSEDAGGEPRMRGPSGCRTRTRRLTCGGPPAEAPLSAPSLVDASPEDATCSSSRAVDVRSGYRPVSSFRSYALTASPSLPSLTSSSTCQRQQSPVLEGRLHQRVKLRPLMSSTT